MAKNITAIKGLVAATFKDVEKNSQTDERTPVIAVSRGFGAQGRVVSKLLAEKIGVKHYDSELIDKLLKEAKTDKSLLKLMDEQLTRNMDNWIYTMFGKGITKGEYYRLLIKTVNLISQTGGVILGRGSHLILSHDPNVFRLRVDGSLDACSRRVASYNNMDLDEAKKLIRKTDSERIKFIKELYNRFPTSRSYYDLMVCTDYLSPEHVVELTLRAMEMRGMHKTQ
ncbi:MAG: cytidylate kinase-like family protein [Magnetococcales bacterium]|nr:cytidylate kinase-like family protein [Magnetococcales bacterium]